jgi:hypothetical protein
LLIVHPDPFVALVASNNIRTQSFVRACTIGAHSLSPRRSMDTATIIEALEAERDRLSAAIRALQGRKRGPGRPPTVLKSGVKRHLSPAARKRISDAMKKRWAARKRAA